MAPTTLWKITARPLPRPSMSTCNLKLRGGQQHHRWGWINRLFSGCRSEELKWRVACFTHRKKENSGWRLRHKQNYCQCVQWTRHLNAFEIVSCHLQNNFIALRLYWSSNKIKSICYQFVIKGLSWQLNLLPFVANLLPSIETDIKRW